MYDEIEVLKYNLFTTLGGIKERYRTGVYRMYQSYKTLTGTILQNVEEAIVFESFHEQLYLKKALGIKSLIK